ncbi:GMC family oxidoreductase [Algicella marina]|uniref:Choline dehydrogenase n=1 Tax=Algicella marina TaxID=2683284 RepID=A0A6P1T1X2_9RHOB|nr:GMC family oxidoreductase N-terminal domain-containing protein [Algicella marina]QHQ35765.1 choline dehydrogenase [Algicella marina]
MSEELSTDYTADVVIVGAGSAGCVLANRLSADPHLSVLLVEAGPADTSPWIHIPVGYFKTMGHPKLDWRYRTEADPGLNGRSIPWPRGRTLGGSSSINGLLYVRGQPRDFDRWRQLGNPGWGWDDVLPYFKRSEHWEDGETEERGGTGPLCVSRSRLSRQIVDAWLEAAQEAGFARNADYNEGDQEGVAQFQLTMRGGWRCSSARAYLSAARLRKNLEILTDSPIEKLHLANNRATGLTVLHRGVQKTICARRLVILSAGAIGSPQILMTSGIGPAAHLQELSIPVIRDQPGVGQGLQDHLQARPVYRCTLPTINTEARSLARKALMAAQFAVNRTGPMTMAASLGTAFLKTRPELDTPDIQFHIQPFSADNPADGPHSFSAFTTSVLQLRPESRGQIRLKTPHLRDAPAIHPNYLATPIDCQTLVSGIRIARRIARQPALARHITAEHAPGPEAEEDDALLEWARNTATTIYHPTGTCRMGDGRMCVVDARLNVHGISNLKVADASIMPEITSGNTNAPTIMIGEKASDIVLEDLQA